MPRVEITITKDGKIKREAFDFKGAACLQKTAFLDDLFGEPVESEVKDEYYQEEDNISNGLPSGWCG
jgi:hypothetical protein